MIWLLQYITTYVQVFDLLNNIQGITIKYYNTVSIYMQQKQFLNLLYLYLIKFI